MTDQKIYNLLVQLNNNVVALKLILQKMLDNGVRVVTQESHTP